MIEPHSVVHFRTAFGQVTALASVSSPGARAVDLYSFRKIFELCRPGKIISLEGAEGILRMNGKAINPARRSR